MEPLPSFFEGQRGPPEAVTRPPTAEAVDNCLAAAPISHVADLRDATLPALPAAERQPDIDPEIFRNPLLAPAPDPSPQPLPESHTVYCLWRHRSDQFPSLRAKLMSEIEGRAVLHVNVFQEGVGGTPAERRAIEARMDAMVNGMSASRWLISKIGSKITSAIAGVFNREAAEDGKFLVENVQLFRDIREKTGAPIRFHLIDMDETHPSFQAVNAAFFPGFDIVDGFLSLRKHEAFDTPRKAAVVVTALAQAYREQLERVGAAIKTRDDLVISQLEDHLAAAPEGSLNVIMVGSGHARIARGSSQPGFGRVVSAMPPHLEGRLPQRFENSLSGDLESMKMRKAACEQPLDTRDEKELILYRALFPLVAERLASEPKLLNGRTLSETITLASFLTTHHIIANRRDVDLLFASCFQSVVDETDPAATLRECLEKPLRKVAENLALDPKRYIGFDPR